MVGLAFQAALLDVGDLALKRCIVIGVQRKYANTFAARAARSLQRRGERISSIRRVGQTTRQLTFSPSRYMSYQPSCGAPFQFLIVSSGYL